jgi:hypothetical protein
MNQNHIQQQFNLQYHCPKNQRLGRLIKGQGNPKDGTQNNNGLGLPLYIADSLFLTVILMVEKITIPLLLVITRFMKKHKKTVTLYFLNRYLEKQEITKQCPKRSVQYCALLQSQRVPYQDGHQGA